MAIKREQENKIIIIEDQNEMTCYVVDALTQNVVSQVAIQLNLEQMVQQPETGPVKMSHITTIARQVVQDTQSMFMMVNMASMPSTKNTFTQKAVKVFTNVFGTKRKSVNLSGNGHTNMIEEEGSHMMEFSPPLPSHPAI